LSPEGPDWADYQDIDGTELPSTAEALVYAYKIIRELTSDGHDKWHGHYMLVKDALRKTVFRIAFR